MLNIGVFDSNDDGSICAIVTRHSNSAVFFSDRDEILKELRSLAKKPFFHLPGRTEKNFSYLLIHQNDVDGLPDIDQWIRSNPAKVLLYSGGATGEGGVFQRAEIRRNLEDFILRVEGNEPDPLQAFRIHPLLGLHQWEHIYQHEFGNLYAPLDFLSLLYQGGDINSDVYQNVKIELQSRVRNYLDTKKHSNKKWDAIFKKGDEAFRDIESVQFNPSNFLSIKGLASFPIIHIDDEIERGWDIVFPAIFGNNYIQANSPEMGMAEIEKHAGGSCIVFLDLRLPNNVGNQPDKKTGLTALREIREKWPLLPVYVFSANTDYESYGDALRAGASGYLVKYARSLETRPDSVLYRELWGVMRSARIANIAHCIYSVFSSIQSHENFVNLPQRVRTKVAILELSQALQFVSFDHLAADDNHSIGHAQYLTIILYKTLEHYVAKDTDKPDDDTPINMFDEIINIPRIFRNHSAHSSKHSVRGKLNEGRVFPGIREVLLSVSLLVTKWGELLKDEEWAQKHLNWLLSIILTNTLERDRLTQRMLEGGIYDWNEKGVVGQIQRFFKGTHLAGLHDIVRALVVDFCDSKNLSDGSLFGWFVDDSLCRINYASARLCAQSSGSSVEPAVNPPATPPKAQAPENGRSGSFGIARKKRQRSLDDLFDIQDGIYFHRMQKYSGQAVDLSNPSQFSYLEWYFANHIQPSRDSYTEEVYNQFQQWFSITKSESVARTKESVPVIDGLVALCLDISSLGATDPRADIIEFARNSGSAWIPKIKRDQVGSLYRPPVSSGGSQALKGFSINNPISIADKKILPVSPSVMLFNTPPPSQSIIGRWVYDGHKIWQPRVNTEALTRPLKVQAEGSHPSTMADAKTAFDYVLNIARQNFPSVTGPISWDRLGSPGQFNEVILVDDKNEKFSLDRVRAAIRQSLEGIKLAVLDKTSQLAEVNELKTNLSRSVGMPDWVSDVVDSDAFIALIEKELSDRQIEELISEFNDHGKPYVVVNPGPSEFKTYGIALGLRSRMSTPLWSLSGRKPKRWFIGLDVGTRQGDESILAASCIDHTGRLRAWCRVSNPGRGTGPERINPNTFQKAMGLIRNKLESELGHGIDTYELVVHRDGNTLEDEQEFISILRDLGFKNDIEWVDVVKNGAPIISGNTSKMSGLYLHVNRNNGSEQYWNLQSVPDGNKYIRPLVVERRGGDSSISVIASEVFYLGQAAAHDYLGRQKLPITTYYADGFSKSGAEFLRFAGYEHLRAY